MRIAIDAIGISRPGGVRSAALNWLRALLQLDNSHQYLIAVDRQEPSLRLGPHVRQVAVGQQPRVVSRLWANLLLPFLLHSHSADLVHHVKDLGTFLSPSKSIVTVHGLSALLRPQAYRRLDVFYQTRVLPGVLRRADRVVAVSQDTARDLSRHFGLEGGKVAVVYPGYDPIFQPQEVAPEELPAPKGYILHVGSISKKKNLPTLLGAYARLRDGGVGHHLLLVEREEDRRLKKEVLAFIRDSGLAGVVHLLGPLPASELVPIYNGAGVFVFPSLHESFGIAPLEALACGVPVVASDVGGIREMMGEGGLVLEDPLDVRGLAEAVGALLEDGARRAELSRQGRERAREFSTIAAAQRLLALYREVAAG